MNYLPLINKYFTTKFDAIKEENNPSTSESKFIKTTKTLNFKQGNLYYEFENNPHQTLSNVAHKLNANMQLYLLDAKDDLENTTNLFSKNSEGNVVLNTDKEINYTNLEELKKIYTEFYENFESELQTKNNLFLRNLIKNYQQNVNLVTEVELQKIKSKFAEVDNKYEEITGMKYEDHKKVDVNQYKKLTELGERLKNLHEQSAIIKFSKELNAYQFEFYSDLNDFMKSILKLNSQYRDMIFYQFKKSDNFNDYNRIAKDLKFLQLATQNKLLLDQSELTSDSILNQILTEEEFKNLNNLNLNYEDFKKNLEEVVDFYKLINYKKYLYNKYYYENINSETKNMNYNKAFDYIMEWSSFDDVDKKKLSYMKIYILKQMFNQKLSSDIENRPFLNI